MTAALNQTVNRPSRYGEVWSHVLAYAFAAHFLFGSVSLLNSLKLEFIFYYPRIVHIILIDPWIDIAVWAASVACISVLAIWASEGRERRIAQIGMGLLAMALSITLVATVKDSSANRIGVYFLFAVATLEFASQVLFRKPARTALISRVLIYFLAAFAAIEIASATHYVIRSFDQTTEVGRFYAGIELQLSYASYGLLPWLYVAFLFSWAWIPLVQRLLPKTMLRVQADSETTINGHENSGDQKPSSKWFSKLLDPKLFLVLAFAAFIGYYPYFQNPPWLVGTDAYWRYYDPLIRMNSSGVFGGFVQALKERHPVPLALLYAAQVIFRTTAFEVVRLAPLFLVATLALSMWWFLARKKKMSFGLIVFMLSTLSITTTVGMYSSILANWMTLVGWILFFAYVSLRGDKVFRVVDFLVLLSLSTFILLLHPWTWGVFAATTLLAALVAVIHEKRKWLRSGGLLVLVILLDVAFAFLSITLLAGGQGWRVANALNLYAFIIRKPTSILYFWDALTRLTQIWAPFFSPLYIAVSILGVFCLGRANLSPWRRRLIFSWLAVSALASILVAPVGFDPKRPTETESQLWRVLFLTPFQITAPFGIMWLAQLPFRGQLNEAKKQLGLGNAVGYIRRVWVVIVFVIGFLLVWAPAWLRLILMVIALPAATGLFLIRTGEEKEFLRDIVLASFMLVAFNNTTRSLSQLLIDPHNYRPQD